MIGASTPSTLHWQDSDVAMADATKGERDIPVPRNFDDLLPPKEDINPSNYIENEPSVATDTQIQNLPQHRIQRVLFTLCDTLQTVFNVIGLSQQYPQRLSYEPDKFIPSILLAKSSPMTADVHNTQGPNPLAGVSEPPHLFPNMSIYCLMTWMNSGSYQKSQTEVMHLVKDVIQADNFNPKDLDEFSVRKCVRALDNNGSQETAIIFPDDWVKTDVNLNIPTKSKNDQGILFSIKGFHYWPLVEVIHSTFSDIQASAFHIFPFKRLWKDPLDDHEKHVFDELYTSDSWLAAQDDLQRQPKEPGCSLEHVIASLMFFLDATHLTNFGMAKAWPLYLYFGNLSKDMQDRLANLRTYSLAGVAVACNFIYTYGSTVDSLRVQTALGEGSWLLTMNAFAEKLGPLGFDAFRMLVVDFMHEWGDSLVASLNYRFHQIPSFSHGVICKFADNTSGMKRLAARDFEDILQCAMPVFEGLFPGEHDAIIQLLLYNFAHWHALAKLWMHSKMSLLALDETFKRLSRQLRKFHDFMCIAFTTMELPKERAACLSNPDAGSGSRKAKKFNLSTYKFHAMGDYVRSIQLFGTTDSFTTQIGELVHRALKAFYPLTSKLNMLAQLAKHEHRRRVLRHVAETGGLHASKHSPINLPAGFRGHHYIPKLSYNNLLYIFQFLQQHDDDPAIAAFIPKLKDHLLYRLQRLDVSYCDHSFTDDEQNSVIIPDNKIYSIQTMQVHYTTYDLQREHDTINPHTHADIMVLSGKMKPQHPYWYARVLGIYHMDVWLSTEGSMIKHQIEALYVRWLAPLIDHQSGIDCTQLPKVAFVEESDHDAFGFLDPAQAIQSAHLIPAFASGRGTSSLHHGRSFAHQGGELDDWEAYFVGIFADRDIFMRYTHCGIGHPKDWERNVQHFQGHNEKSIGDEDESEDKGGDDNDNEDNEGEEEEEEEEEDANYWSF
ncbi:hypothetical protein BD769DRAFT_1665020 [Suillus cothurnatus]|nr:hypothetical protein BD769DRAFT_1665020 [Suillus cothurnatus]